MSKFHKLLDGISDAFDKVFGLEPKPALVKVPEPWPDAPAPDKGEVNTPVQEPVRPPPPVPQKPTAKTVDRKKVGKLTAEEHTGVLNLLDAVEAQAPIRSVLFRAAHPEFGPGYQTVVARLTQAADLGLSPKDEALAIREEIL